MVASAVMLMAVVCGAAKEVRLRLAFGRRLSFSRPPGLGWVRAREEHRSAWWLDRAGATAVLDRAAWAGRAPLAGSRALPPCSPRRPAGGASMCTCADQAQGQLARGQGGHQRRSCPRSPDGHQVHDSQRWQRVRAVNAAAATAAFVRRIPPHVSDDRNHHHPPPPTPVPVCGAAVARHSTLC